MSICTSSLRHFITSYWKTRLPHVCIPMTEIALGSACRLLIVFACFCLLRLLVKEIFVNCSWFLLCLFNTVPVSLENYRQLQCVHTFRLWGIYDLCLLLQREPVQVCLTCELCKIFSELFLSSGFIHGNARHFITSNLKLFVVMRTEKQKPKA